MMNNFIIYEQPLNEQVRICLRLEYLFTQVDYFLKCDSVWEINQTLSAILKIIHLADRPDLKNKLGQTLNQYASSLSQLEKRTDIDKHKLNDLLKQIDQLIDEIRANTQKSGQELRENEFLLAVQQRLYTPGGICNFSLPSYHLWLQQDKSVLKKQLLKWLDSLAQLRTIVNLLLKLIRESSYLKATTAIGGFYQTNLEPNIQHQMVRISVAAEQNIFPEISVGRHRMTIHFFSLDVDGKIAQTTKDIAFSIACCKV
jgi:cell division protein ZapD